MKALVAWSGGKDSALALHETLRRSDATVAGLVVTVNAALDRASMHGVRSELLAAQADALGLPFLPARVEAPAAPDRFTIFPPNAAYERALGDVCTRAKAEGVDTIVFGDLFLEDLRAYRETLCARLGLEPVFPLWGRDSEVLVGEAIALGFEARIVCVHTEALDPSWLGRRLDGTFAGALPPGVDPAGENGEFHTFVTDGPGFAHPVRVRAGATGEHDGYAFQDLTLEREAG